MRASSRFVTSCLLLWILGTASVPALTVHTDFPGGSAEVREITEGRIAISPSLHEERGWPCWWYFRVEGAQPGAKLTLEVMPNAKPFRAEARLAASWSTPQRIALSSDNEVWTQSAPGVIGKESGVWEVIAPSERFWLAWGPPFLPEHAERLLAEAAARCTTAERFELARTRQGRPVPGIRLGAATAPVAVWVQARQHAWEAGGSWVGRGFLEWVTGDDPAAAALRDKAEIFFIPIMDVDNVTLGAGGKEAVPRDHNRDWSAEPVYPEVAAAKARVQALADAGRLRVFLDLHNPGPGDKQPFYFGPLDYETLSGKRRANYDRFLKLSIATMTAPLAIHPQYRFATYVKTDEERARMSGNWARHLPDENILALTLETAWNTPHSTADGYRRVGANLARVVADYLRPAAE